MQPNYGCLLPSFSKHRPDFSTDYPRDFHPTYDIGASRYNLNGAESTLAHDSIHIVGSATIHKLERLLGLINALDQHGTHFSLVCETVTSGILFSNAAVTSYGPCGR